MVDPPALLNAIQPTPTDAQPSAVSATDQPSSGLLAPIAAKVAFRPHSNERLPSHKLSSIGAERQRRGTSVSSRYSLAGRAIPAPTTGRPIFQATYRLAPVHHPYQPEFVQSLVRQTVDAAVANCALEEYKPGRSNRFCANLARELQRLVQLQSYDRYRIVAWVTLVERHNSSAIAKMAFLWDAQLDHWCTYEVNRPNYQLCAVVCGVYWE